MFSAKDFYSFVISQSGWENKIKILFFDMKIIFAVSFLSCAYYLFDLSV
jgi:hypothetical protein